MDILLMDFVAWFSMLIVAGCDETQILLILLKMEIHFGSEATKHMGFAIEKVVLLDFLVFAIDLESMFQEEVKEKATSQELGKISLAVMEKVFRPTLE